MANDLSRLTVTEATARIAQGALTSEALVAACLERVAAREAEVGAWEYIDPDAVLAAARQRDREPSRGPLHGVPFGVKDIIDTADMPTRMGSPIYADNRPKADADCVAAIRAAGAIVMGKTVTTEFATFRPGKTVHPHNPAHTPGGSSSGTAAGVADFMVPAGFGTQTSGSVIRPASFCGVCGYKPSFGAVSRKGVKVIVPSLDCVGTMARSVDDLALIQDVVTGRTPEPLPPHTRAPRIAICTTPRWAEAEPATVAAMQQAKELLAKAGAESTTVALPPHFEKLWAAHATIMDVGLGRSLRPEYDAHKDLLAERLVARMERGMATPVQAWLDALALAYRCRTEFDAIAGEWDAVLTPSARGEAPKDLSNTGDPAFNMVWTLLHVPCVTVPGLTGPGGLPVGLQLVGPRGADRKVLAAAKWLHGKLTR